MEKIVILSRVSSLPQNIEPQTKELVDYAYRLGYSKEQMIVIETVESAIKLSEEERLGIQKLKYSIENDNVKCVVCWEPSRLSRQQKTLYSIRDYLISKKIQLYILHPECKLLDDNGNIDPTSNIVFSIFSVIAENEMTTKIERFKRAKNQLRQEGKKFAGAVRFGWVKTSDKHCVPHPLHSKIIQSIYDHYANTDHSLYETYMWAMTQWPEEFPLLEYKKAQHKIRHWFEHSVYYTGDWCYQPLITKETWDKVHEKMHQGRCTARRIGKKEYLCRGKIYCGHCGRMMTGSGGNVKAYVCSTDKLHSCQLNIETADWIIWERCKDIININASIDYNKKMIELQQMISDRKIKCSKFESEIKKLEEKNEKLIDLYLNSMIDKDKYTARASQIEQDTLKYKSSINTHQQEIRSLESVLQQTEQDVVFHQNIDVENIDDFKTREEFVRKYIKKMIVTKTAPKHFNITFEYTQPLILNRYWFKVQVRNQRKIIIRVNEDGTEDLL